MASNAVAVDHKPVDRARGMINAPLSEEGQRQADHLGARIAAKGGVDTIVSSPMKRALGTVAAIQRHNPKARLLGVADDLRPLQQAGLEGRTKDEVGPAMRHFAAHPDERIPGIGPSGVPGESLAQHGHRILKEVHRQLATLQPGERRLVLLHHSGIRAVRGALKHGLKKSDPSEMATPKDVARPAGEILRLVNKGGKPDLESNPLESDKPIGPGLNFARHGATELNAGGVVGRLAQHAGHKGMMS